MPDNRKNAATMGKVDIVLSVFNQEKIISRVLGGIFDHTLTPFNLILIFDGCTDASQMVALDFIDKASPALLRSLVVKEAPNVYETRANNIGFRLSTADYMVTIQDDMVIRELGWEIRLTYPLRKFDNVLAVSARIAQDIRRIDGTEQIFDHQVGRELFNLPRNTFAVRDIVNRGPIAFKMNYLRQLDFLNEKYAPSDLDDADLSLRAWKEYKWKVGAFWIDYESDASWSKSKAKDSTMNARASSLKNAEQIKDDHGDYLRSGEKHREDILIQETEIDYPQSIDRQKLKRDMHTLQIRYVFKNYPRRLKRSFKDKSRAIVYEILRVLGMPDAHKIGMRQALRTKFSKDPE